MAVVKSVLEKKNLLLEKPIVHGSAFFAAAALEGQPRKSEGWKRFLQKQHEGKRRGEERFLTAKTPRPQRYGGRPRGEKDEV